MRRVGSFCLITSSTLGQTPACGAFLPAVFQTISFLTLPLKEVFQMSSPNKRMRVEPPSKVAGPPRPAWLRLPNARGYTLVDMNRPVPALIPNDFIFRFPAAYSDFQFPVLSWPEQCQSRGVSSGPTAVFSTATLEAPIGRPASGREDAKEEAASGSQGPGGPGKGKKIATIYTDGACASNGQLGARAGYGIYYEDDILPRVSRPLEGDKQTNVRAEWMAVVEAFQAIADQPQLFASPVLIYTDHEAIIKTLQGWKGSKPWYPGWRRKANAGVWMKSGGGVVENQDIIKRAVDLYERVKHSHSVQLEWVKGHNGLAGNEIADTLAVQGAMRD